MAEFTEAWACKVLGLVPSDLMPIEQFSAYQKERIACVLRGAQEATPAQAEPLTEPVLDERKAFDAWWKADDRNRFGSPSHPLAEKLGAWDGWMYRAARQARASQPVRVALTGAQIEDLGITKGLLLICDGIEELVEIARAIERAHGITKGGDNAE